MAISDRLLGLKLSLVLNHACNLRCSYCYTGRKFDRRMPLEVARRAIDLGFERAGTGFLELAFFGGEPLLEFDAMREIVAYARDAAKARERRLFLALSTNATLLDDARVRFLAENKFSVQLSVDGLPQAQDACRVDAGGGGSSAGVEAGIRRALTAGIVPRVVSVVDPANVDWLPDSLDYLYGLGLPQLYFVENSHGSWDDAACGRFETALRALGDRYIAMFRRGQDIRLDPFNGKILTHLLKGTRDPLRCGFAMNELAVSPRGRLYPCDRLVAEDDNDEVCIGSLETGVDDARRLAILAARDEVDPECRECALNARCAHWCGCLNYETMKHPGRVSPQHCWFEQCWIAEADRVANTLFDEKNPTFLRRFYGSLAKPNRG